MRHLSKVSVLVLLFSVFSLSAGAQGVPAAPMDGVPEAPLGKDKRQKSLEFESGLVEGVSSDSSLDTVATKDRSANKEHLYRRDRFFDRERAQTIKQLRFQQ